LAVFAGDGTVEPFRDRPEVLDARLAAVDCSFFEPGTRVAARLGGHGHIRDWLDLLPDLTCDVLVLSHLPPEATAERLIELLEAVPARRPMIVPWIHPPIRE
jgi:hypothetical protein